MIRKIVIGFFSILWKIIKTIAVIKWKIIKTCALFFFIFSVVEAISIRALYRDLAIRRDNYFAKQINEVDVAYKAMTQTYGLNATTIYDNLLDLPGVLDIIREAQDADNVRRAILRDRLYEQVLPLYKRAIDQDAPLFNVYLADGTTFLRMHDSAEFGDNIFETSPLNAWVRDHTEQAAGFEAGQDFFAYRYIAPIFSNGRYLGNVELGVSLDWLKTQMERLLLRKFIFLLHRQVVEQYPRMYGTFITSELSPDYVSEEQDLWISDTLWEFLPEEEIQADMEANVREYLQWKLAAGLERHAAFATSLKPELLAIKSRDLIFSFLPISDNQGQHMAYLVAYHRDDTLNQYSKEFFVRVGGATVGWLLVLTFIFFIKRSRKQVVRSKDQLQRITDNMNEGLCVLDEDQKITFVNPATERLLGYRRQELLGQGVDAIFHCWERNDTPKDATSCSLCRVIETAEFDHSDEYLLETKHGKLIVELVVSPLRDKKKKKVLGSVLVFHDITARKDAEKELREAKAFTESILDNVPEVIYSLDQEGNLTYISPKCEELSGYTAEEFLQERHLFMKLVHPDDRDSVKRETRQAVQQGHILSKEFRFIKKDGTTIWVRQSATPTLDEHGAFLRVDASLYDITAIKEAESALAEERNLLRTLIDHLPDVVYVKNTEGRYLTVNQKFMQVFNVDGDADCPGKCLEKMPTEHWDQTLGRLEQQVLETHVPVLLQEEYYASVEMWVSRTIVPLRNHQGEIFGILAIMRDVTDRKLAEDKLVDANIELKEMLNNLKRTQNELVESAKMAALGQLIAGVAHEINTPLGAIRASISNITHALNQSTHQLPFVFQRLNPEEQQRFLELVDYALQPKHQLTSKEERRLRRALEAELETQQIAPADSLADMLVDMGLSTYMPKFDALFRREDANMIVQTAYHLAIQQHGSENISIAVERASKVVFALKNYTHYDHTGDKTDAAITDTIDTVLTLYHNQLKHGIDVVKAYDTEPVMRCYPDELNQVWTNLIHNAIQAMSGVGRLEIGVSQRPFGDIPEAWRSDAGRWDEYVVVEFSDSGAGISPEIHARIFDPFFTTKPAGEGSGLGLDICRRIVDKHQGTIGFDSQPGRTTFRVVLPVIR